MTHPVFVWPRNVDLERSSSPVADTTAHCLDAGCGEGYYLRELTDYDAPDTFDQFLADLKARARQDKSPRWSIAPTSGAGAAQHGGRQPYVEATVGAGGSAFEAG